MAIPKAHKGKPQLSHFAALQRTWVMVAQGTLPVGVPSLAGSVPRTTMVRSTGVTGKSQPPPCSCLALLSPSLRDLVKEYMFSLGKRMLLIAWTRLGTFLPVSIKFILRDSSHILKARDLQWNWFLWFTSFKDTEASNSRWIQEEHGLWESRPKHQGHF